MLTWTMAIVILPHQHLLGPRNLSKGGTLSLFMIPQAHHPCRGKGHSHAHHMKEAPDALETDFFNDGRGMFAASGVWNIVMDLLMDRDG